MEMNVEPVISIPMADNNSLSALGARSVLARREPMYVIDLSVQIQRGFRIKMLTILLLQLILTMAISISLRAITSEGPEPTWLAIAFPPKSLQTLALGLVCIGSLPMMTYVRDIHPWNIVVTVIWTLGWAVFLAVAQLPGALILSNTFFVVFGACTLGVAVLLILSTLTTTDQETGDKRLWSFKSAGTIAGARFPPAYERFTPLHTSDLPPFDQKPSHRDDSFSVDRYCDARRFLCLLLANHPLLRAGRCRSLHHGKSHRGVPLRLGRVRSKPLEERLYPSPNFKHPSPSRMHTLIPPTPLGLCSRQVRLGQAVRAHAARRLHEGRHLLLHRLSYGVLLLPLCGVHGQRGLVDGALVARRYPPSVQIDGERVCVWVCCTRGAPYTLRPRAGVWRVVRADKYNS